MEHFTCVDCKQEKPVQTDGGTGYAKDSYGSHVCYDCCAERDRDHMRNHEKTVLYLDHDKREIVNWPGTLRMPVREMRRFFHAFAHEGKAYCGSFIGPDGKVWLFKNIGDSQIAHCRRSRAKVA